jgi:hypothetical protein
MEQCQREPGVPMMASYPGSVIERNRGNRQWEILEYFRGAELSFRSLAGPPMGSMAHLPAPEFRGLYMEVSYLNWNMLDCSIASH